jgi:hypothetical protein
MSLYKNEALGQVLTNYVTLLWLEDGQSLSRGTILFMKDMIAFLVNITMYDS